MQVYLGYYRSGYNCLPLTKACSFEADHIEGVAGGGLCPQPRPLEAH